MAEAISEEYYNEKNFIAVSIDNVFFFKSHISKFNYKGKFLMGDIFEKDVILEINKVTKLKDGSL